MKGISPLLAAVLLVGFTIAVAAIVINFGQEFISTQTSIVGSRGENFTDCSFGVIGIEGVDCTTRDEGLVGYWKFDEGSGNTTADWSGNGNTGNLMDMNTTAPDNATGNLTSGWNSTACRHGNCLNFDGRDDYVDLGNASVISPTDAITIEAWIYPISLGAGNYGRVVAKGNNDYGLMIQGNTRITFNLNGTAYGTTPIGSLLLNNWSHVAGTFDKNLATQQIKTYINGVQLGNGTRTTPIDYWPSVGDNYSTGFIGNNLYLDRGFNGTIDEVRIYNRALSTGEIQQQYQNGVAIRALVSNEGAPDLGRDFMLSYTAGESFNQTRISLGSSLTSGQFAWLVVPNITVGGRLTSVKVNSLLCPNVVAKEKEITGFIC